MLLALVALAFAVACRQSLFADGTSGGGGGGGGGGADGGGSGVPATCPSPCVADAGADFGDTTHPWRYLEDHRDRTWTPMTLSGDTATGADSANSITSCAHHDADACHTLPGALLVSSSGSSSAADPAVELAIKTNQNVKVELGAYVASGEAQTIRLYRNSREDVLFTGTANPGSMLATTLTLDVLAGDRLLVAVAPSAAGAADVGIQLFVSGTGAAFPSDCELALEFASSSGTLVHNSCGTALTSMLYDEEEDTSAPAPIMDTAAPYPELGSAGLLAADDFYNGSAALDRTGDTTTQLWLRQDQVYDDTAAWYYSDLDLDNLGGVGIDVGTDDSDNPVIETYTCVTTDPSADSFLDGITVPLANDRAWHFVRVVYSNGELALCVDGVRQGSKVFGPITTTQAPYVGKDVNWSPGAAYVVGAVDDVRVIRGALPCE
jgi:hypothetical protein